MKRDLLLVLQVLHRLGINIVIENTAPSGGFSVRIVGKPGEAPARKHFPANQLDQVADWLVVTVQSQHPKDMPKALRDL